MKAEHKMRVLIVDGDISSRVASKKSLESAGIEGSDSAFDLRSALEKVAGGEFNLVLLDLNLPDSQGLATLISMQRANSHIAIVVMCAASDEELALQCVRNGAQGYIVKWIADPDYMGRMIRVAGARKSFEDEQRDVRLRAVLDCMGEGFCQVDMDNQIVYINPTAEKLLGYTMQEVLGHRLHNKLHYMFPDRTFRPAETCPLVRAFRAGSPHHDDDDYFIRKDGTFISIEYSSAPLVVDGKPIGGIICFRDISDRKQMQQQAAEQLQNSI